MFQENPVRITILLVIVISSFASAASPAPKKTDQTFPSLKPVEVNMGPGCRVRLLIPEQSQYSFSYPGYTDKGEKDINWINGGLSFNLANPPYWKGYWHLGFTCFQSDSVQARNDSVAFDDKRQAWITNPDATFIIPEEHFTLHQVISRNARGWAYTSDDTAVDVPSRRLQYCVYRGEKAICGKSDVGNLGTIRRHPLADRTRYVLDMLNSIEFLEDAPPPMRNK